MTDRVKTISPPGSPLSRHMTGFYSAVDMFALYVQFHGDFGPGGGFLDYNVLAEDPLAGQLTEKGVFKTAERVGMDVDRLRKDMESPEIAQSLVRTQQLASALGITGTPAFVIGIELVPGAVSLEQLKSFVRRARKGG